MDTKTFGLEAEVSLDFAITKPVFLNLLEKTAVVIPTKDIIPVLNNFQIQTSSTSLRILTTNLDISMICSTKGVDIAQAGIAYFPVKRLLEIIRECDFDINITVKDQTATIASGRTTWTLKLHSGVGYPDVQAFSDLVIKEIEQESFVDAIKTVKYAAATTQAKASMMMLTLEREKLTACDGIRLHQTHIKDFPFDLQIPIESVDDILKLVDHHEMIKVGHSLKHIVVLTGSDILIINKMVEEFPDVNSLMLGPALRNQITLKVNVSNLVNAIKSVRVSADLESPAMSFDVSASGIILKSLDRYGNTAESFVDIVEFDRPESGNKESLRTLVFNHKMFLQMLSVCVSPVCEFRLAENDRQKKFPILMHDDASGSTAVLQQMTSMILER